MDVILLERIAKLGQMGDVVRVKDGFARNFLLPQGKALRANENSKARFDKMKVELEARNLQNRSEAEKVGKKIDGKTFTVLRQAAEGGQLYGSVSPRDIATLVSEKGFAVSRSQIALHVPIKAVGKHAVPITLHPEVDVAITIIVARNADEAGRIERGENILTARDEDREADAQAAAIAAEAAAAFFEPDGPDSRRDREQAPEAEDDTGDARKPAWP